MWPHYTHVRKKPKIKYHIKERTNNVTHSIRHVYFKYSLKMSSKAESALLFFKDFRLLMIYSAVKGWLRSTVRSFIRFRSISSGTSFLSGFSFNVLKWSKKVSFDIRLILTFLVNIYLIEANKIWKRLVDYPTELYMIPTFTYSPLLSIPMLVYIHALF